MSATHMAIASGASMPDRRAMLSHFAAWVLRRSMTRSKSNMGVPGGESQMTGDRGIGLPLASIALPARGSNVDQRVMPRRRPAPARTSPDEGDAAPARETPPEAAQKKSAPLT